MPLVTVVLVLIAVGVLLWLAQRYLPMDAQIKRIIQIVVIVAVVLWLLQVFGLLALIWAVRVGR